MPQFEVAQRGQEPALVRARDAADAVRRRLADGDRRPGASEPAVALAEPEPGSGWQAVTVGGEPWGQVRPRDRMRFRRD